jgi:nucleotide-binding universal stress UspA family protein
MMEPIKRILAPVDFSSCSEMAARYAVDLAEKLGAEVTLFNAYFFPVAIPFPDGSAYIPTAESVAELATSTMHQLRALRDKVQRAGVRIELASGEGPARQVIPSVAQDRKFDLVVVGTHGRTGLAHAVIGSVAEAVVRHSKVPVLTVRTPKHADQQAA